MIVSSPTGAVFISYTSEDADAAQRIAAALKNAGIEVWFDKSALRGGDIWDRHIREQIRTCRLFIPLISQHTQSRPEGYFRLEWKLAVDRSYLMAAEMPFLVPVVIDATAESGAFVPDRFREVQWMRVDTGEPDPEFVGRIRQLLLPFSPEAGSRADTYRVTPGRKERLPTRNRLRWSALIALAVLLGISASALWWGELAGHRQSPLPFIPPPHSVAVLPFTNLSGDPKQEYLSDGLTEELINSLAHVNALQVAARTSSFAFKGQNVDIGTIARKLGVAAVLEGSVRRSGNTVRITAQLINANNGFDIWSEDYNRDLRDVLTLQT